MMTNQAELTPGFDDYGPDANAAFRSCLEALSRPGTIQPFATNLQTHSPLLSTTAAVLLTLADFETSVWLDSPLQSSQPVRDYLRFHTGAQEAPSPESADFAIISDVSNMPAFNQFSLGTPEYPDRSTTIILQVDDLASTGMTFSGPGIDGAINLAVAPAPARFAEQLVDNRQRFPLGVDLMFVTKTHIAALPRSVCVRNEV